MDAFRLVLEQIPTARLNIVGDGPQAEDLQRQAADLPVTFTGYLSGAALVSAYEQADIFVFPSTTDTYGKVVLEAQADNVPRAGKLRIPPTSRPAEPVFL